ncbi:MAG: SRPBCC family protein [Acidimicrobiales bacterium]|jgi:uncharacterized protein YndB with AHSA1/START domain
MQERDLSFVDSAPVRIEAAVTVIATRAQVWAVLADHRGWPNWFGPSLTSCEPTSETEQGVGSTRRVTLRGGTTVDERFIAWDEPEVWSFTGTAMKPALFRELVERVVLAPIGDDRTRVTYTMALTPAPALRPFVPLLKAGVSRSLRGALEELGRTAASQPDT